MANTFEDLVKRHSKQNEALDVEPRRQWWLSKVEALFDEVKSWLNPLIEDGTLKYETSEVSINEEWIGHYTTKSATIRLGMEKLEMMPVGTIILGSFGRIDLKGPRD